VAAVLQHARIPGVVEDHHLALAGKGELVAPEKVVAQLERGRGPATIHLIEAGIEQFGKLLDDLTAAASVPAFQTDNYRDIGFLDGVLQQAQAALQSLDTHSGGGLRELLVEIEFFQHKSRYSDSWLCGVSRGSSSRQDEGRSRRAGPRNYPPAPNAPVSICAR